MTDLMKRQCPHFDVNVLGTTYTVYLGSCEDLGIKETVDGDCEAMGKVIRLRTDMKDDWEGDIKLREKYVRQVLYHELAHAFFFESGLLELFDNERMCEWLEINAVKMVTAAQNSFQTLSACLDALDRKEES